MRFFELTPTHVSDDAARRQVQEELPYLGPGFVAAVVEIRSDLVVDAVHVLSLQLAGSLLHHAGPGRLVQWPQSIVPAEEITSVCLFSQSQIYQEMIPPRKVSVVILRQRCQRAG